VIEGSPWLPRVYAGAGYRVPPDGMWWPNKKHAELAARGIGWPLSSVVRIHTRFQIGYALSCSLGGCLTKQDYCELTTQNPQWMLADKHTTEEYLRNHLIEDKEARQPAHGKEK